MFLTVYFATNVKSSTISYCEVSFIVNAIAFCYVICSVFCTNYIEFTVNLFFLFIMSMKGVVDSFMSFQILVGPFSPHLTSCFQSACTNRKRLINVRVCNYFFIFFVYDP